jgi:preprotein translocase subunit SecY
MDGIDVDRRSLGHRRRRPEFVALVVLPLVLVAVERCGLVLVALVVLTLVVVAVVFLAMVRRQLVIRSDRVSP